MNARYLAALLAGLLMLCEQVHWTTGAKDPIVYELDDRVIDYTTQGKWLIMFYAPWCGHCKKLEPVFTELAKYFEGKFMNIAKVDATRFIKAANHFEIKGYPTIKFIYGKQNINFYGERRKEDLIEFFERCDAPKVALAHHELDFENIKYEKPLFFLIVARREDEKHPVVTEYFAMAEKHFLEAFFYYAHPDHIKKTAKIQTTPRVGVVKDSELLLHDPSQFSMERFIQLEQFLTFCEITLTNYYHLLETRKTLIILVIDTQDEKRLPQTRKLKQAFKIYSRTKKRTYKNEFHFGYTENHDLINGIAIWTLQPPILFILNTTTFQYAIIELLDKKNHVIDFDIDKIMNDLRENNITFYGGHSWFRSFRRPLWELYRAIMEMFIEAPFISLLIFGFPFGVISIVCYFLCCLDTSDSNEENEPHSDVDESDLEDENLKSCEKLDQIGDINTTELKLPIKTGSKKNQ